jgi:hypothetical protein
VAVVITTVGLAFLNTAGPNALRLSTRVAVTVTIISDMTTARNSRVYTTQALSVAAIQGAAVSVIAVRRQLTTPRFLLENAILLHALPGQA